MEYAGLLISEEESRVLIVPKEAIIDRGVHLLGGPAQSPLNSQIPRTGIIISSSQGHYNTEKAAVQTGDRIDDPGQKVPCESLSRGETDSEA
jgi:hypothetical protein